MQTPSLLLDQQNRRNGNMAFSAGGSNRPQRDDDGLSVAGQKRSVSAFAGEADDDHDDNSMRQSREGKRFKRTSFTFQSPSDEDLDELRRATVFRGRSGFEGRRGEGVGFGRGGKVGSSGTFAAAAAPFPPKTKTKTTTGSPAFSSGVKGSSGLASRTSHPPPSASGSSRNAGTMVQGKTPGFPFILDDDDSSSSSEDEGEEIQVEGDELSTSFSSSPAFDRAGKQTMGLFPVSSSDVAGQEGLRDYELRRKEGQRVESERLRRDALVRRRRRGKEMEESVSGVGFGFVGLGAVKEEEEEVDVKMEDERDVKVEEEEGAKMEDEGDVKMEEEDRVVVDRSGRDAEVITLSDSDGEDDVKAVAPATSRSSSMAGLPHGGNTKTLNDETKPHQANNVAKNLRFSTEERIRHRPETAPEETPNTSNTQGRESAPPKNTAEPDFPPHHSSRQPTVSSPPSKPSSLRDATERIRQERLENAKRIWEGTQARAQAEAEKARQREAEARAEDVHRHSTYSGSTPDLLERLTRPGLPSGNVEPEVKSREMHKDPKEGIRQGKIYSGKGEEVSPFRAADAEAKKKTNDEKAMQHEPQKKDIRRESLIEQTATNKPSIEDLARQRKDRQAALVREAEQKLALEAAKKAENEKQMAAYKNAMNSKFADRPVHSKQLSSAKNDRDCGRGVQTHFERNDRNRQAAEGGKQDVSKCRIEDHLDTGAENVQHGIRHPPDENLSSRRPMLGGAPRNDRGQGKKDAPMSLGSFAILEEPKAANVAEEPLRTYGQSRSTSAVNPQGPPHQPTSLKAIAEQGGTITRVKAAQPEPLQPQNLKKSHVPRIEILPEDIKLLFWRDAGNEWQDIIEDYEEATGRRKSEDTLRKRYRQVKEALSGVGASKELLARVGTGDLEAKRALDAMIPQAAGDSEKRPNRDTKPGIVAPGKDQLGELTPQDIRLLVSKGKGMVWSQTVQDFAISTGENVSETLLRARYKLVKEAIEKSEVDASLLTQVMAGEDAARESLNRLVHGVWPVPRVESDFKVDRPSKGSSRDRRLGHVSADDIRLVRWKDEGMSGAEMVEALKQTTGRLKNVSTVLKRCSLVRRGLEASGLHADRGLLDRVASGDPEAIARTNQVLQSLSAPTGTAGTAARPSTDVAPRLPTMTAHHEPSFHVQQAKQVSDSASAYSSSYGSREDQNVSTPPTSPGSIVPQPIVQESRTTTAGKQMNEAAFRYYLEEIREERLREEDSDADSDGEEEDNFPPEDFCHFIYQVERRELTKSEEDITIDEKNWISYGEPLTDRLKATAMASKQALVAHDTQLNDAIHAGNDWSLTRQNLNSGILYTLDSPPAGTVQVRVQQYQRSFQEQIRPSDSVAWVDRTTYTVMQRRTETAREKKTVTVTEKQSDPLFGEEDDLATEKEVDSVRETHTEQVVGNLVYTTPDLANDAAMRHFVAKTYHPKTINLTVRDLERADLIKGFKEKYEGQGEEGVSLFREIVEDDGNSLEVWVQETQLKGPRNV
ncbi:hypothetical protein KC340_g5748 [Hortaea werneckii]|nr:hypothetical protein KC342_g15154 [Hortaea werneckii]KAI7099679.1 hypothetical protein KC339_g8024 [Hortaea werneckii]KAI7218005.1 hypothetical protein KC365_g12766 [Hortaea werneckii]KAI7327038.1 hypothetical protein KC340_g5748 [Hortaea werneckii]KAI7382350.1 hypothetical protein KC328_g11779 [Hortaea werneckii]